MTFPIVPGVTAKTHIQETRPERLEASLAQGLSGKTSIIVSDGRLHTVPIARQDAPVAKPWAHFVAGGLRTYPWYDSSIMTADLI